jgi:spoIIIJ-associated protein
VIASVDPSAVAAAPSAPAEEGELATEVREVLERVLEAIGVAARVEIREDDESLVATVTGRELGLVIGKHGQTIDAIQYLVNAIAWREHGEERKPVVVDAAGYRERREATLGTLALRSAERAKASGQRGRARPDDGRRAQGRPHAPEGSAGRDHAERGHRAEPLHHRRARVIEPK